MKQTIKKKLHSLALIIIVLCSFSLSVSAEKLPDGVMIGDESGLDANRNGEYLVHLTNVMPGKKWEKTISMMNMEKNSTFALSMQISPPVVSGPLDLSKEIHMTLEYDGKQIYDGPASGISSNEDLQAERFQLGTFNSGDSRALKVTYEMSGEYTNEDFAEKSIMDNVWTFYAIKAQDSSTNTPKKNTSGILPQTGDIQKSMILICLALFVILIILFVWKSRNDSKQKINE